MLEKRVVLAAGGLEISEFLARNTNGLRDQFNLREDWIEIHNNSPAAIDLGGYFLTDDKDELDQWEFPSLVIQPDQYLVVFASGKDLKDPAAPLHTNFGLNDGGEYLALVKPDQSTIVDHFDPEFPNQTTDLSYGIATSTQTTPLITASATPRVRVPTATDAGVGIGWTLTSYDASSWATGQLGVGFDADPLPPPGTPGFNVRVIDTTGTNIGDISHAKNLLNGNTSGFTISSNLSVTSAAVSYPTTYALPNGATSATPDNDPRREGYALRATSLVTIPQGTYTVSVNSDDGFQLTIPGVNFTSRVNENAQGSSSAADQITFGAPRGAADTRGTFTVGPGGLSTTITLDFYENSGGDNVSLSVASGASAFVLLQNGSFGWGVYSSPPAPHFDAVVKTDLQSQMHNVNAGAYLRLPFVLENAADFDALKLRVKYDDGFVAYVNGHPVMSRNAPQSPAWDSAATGSHADGAALIFEELTIPGVGQYLVNGINTLAIHALNASAADPDFLIIPELDGVRTLASSLSFFPTPTPGGPNSSATLGKVADTKFSKDRGFYDQPFPVKITTETAGAQIRYTLDGSAPTANTGLVYSGPITVSKTTTLRAAAFRTGFLSSDVDTQTYLFLTDVLKQPAAPPAGYPSTWNGITADHEMDPNVVNSTTYANRMIDAMKAIPTMSLVLNKDDMFSASTGLYQNTGGTGVAWERPTSMEMIYPDGRDGVQVNAGLRIQGGAGRNPNLVTKHSFRLVFSQRTGVTKFEFPFFDGSRVTEFDTITLRAGFNNSWNFTPPSEQARATYTQDEWMRVAQRDMGQLAGQGNFVHLYINGMYWGLYNPTERPSAPFAADWQGGQKEDYDALNSSEPIDGDKQAWDTLQGLVNAPDIADPAKYAQVKQYLDVENLIDYMIINFFGGNQDWDDHNWYAARKREPGAGYRFFSWDGERTLEDPNTNRTGVNQADKPSRLYAQLRLNADFRILFADRVQKHFFNGGALTVAANQARYTAIMNQIDKAILGESARWGDSRREPPYTRDVEWVAERNRVMNQYFPVRSNNMVAQFRGISLFPAANVSAPTFNQFGGTFAPGFNLTMGAAGNLAGKIYYTLDGSDPRLPGVAGTPQSLNGLLNPNAIEYTGPIALADGARVRARYLTSGATPTWSALTDATFFPSTTPALRVTEVMYHPTEPPLGSVFGKDEFEYIEVANTGATPLPLGGMRFGNGITFTFPAMTLGAGERTVVVRNLTAFQSRYGTNVATAGVFTDQLDNAGERIRLETGLGQVIQDFKYDDDWYRATDGDGYSLVAVDPMATNVVLSSQDGWRASTPPAGAPGLADAGVNHNAVIVNEVMPAAPVGDPDGDWIELRNTTAAALDVGGWFVSDSASNLMKYRIADGTMIPAGGFLVLDQHTHFGNAADPGATVPFSLADGGGAVFVSGHDGLGGLSGYRDSVDYGAAETGVSVGRHVKSTGGSDFVAQGAATPGAVNATPQVGPVVINEISYNPVGFGIEFVELHNLTAAAAPLYDPANPANVWRFTDAIQFDFPAGAELPANGYGIVSAVDPAAFRAQYSIPASVPVWGPFVGSLDNAGESIELSRPGVPDGLGVVPYYRADKVTYDGEAPWPAAANGGGPTLSKAVSGAYGNDAGNWTTYGTGGTPGTANNVIAPVISAGASPVTLNEGQAFVRNGSFADASVGETWTAVVNWGDGGGDVPLALNADKTFTLNHSYAQTGAFTVTITVTDSGGAFGTATVQVSVLDLTPPTIVQRFFDGQTAPHRLVVRFSESVGVSLTAEDLTLQNLATGQTIPTANVQVGYDTLTNVATFTFVGLPGNVLPDGNYRATLNAAGIRDAGNNPLSGPPSNDFTVYAGDVNGDKVVNFADLVVLAQNYNTVGGQTFDKGDFNYDGDVDFEDLVILAQRYNRVLGAAAGPAAGSVAELQPALAALFAAPSATPVATVAPAPAKAKNVAPAVFSTKAIAKPVAKPVAKPAPVRAKAGMGRR